MQTPLRFLVRKLGKEHPAKLRFASLNCSAPPRIFEILGVFFYSPHPSLTLRIAWGNEGRHTPAQKEETTWK